MYYRHGTPAPSSPLRAFGDRVLPAKAGLHVDAIGLWKINEAFAMQVQHCRDRPSIPDERLNGNGGGIAVGHALIEDRRRAVRYVVIAMCIGDGMGAAGLFEVLP